MVMYEEIGRRVVTIFKNLAAYLNISSADLHWTVPILGDGEITRSVVGSLMGKLTYADTWRGSEKWASRAAQCAFPAQFRFSQRNIRYGYDNRTK